MDRGEVEGGFRELQHDLCRVLAEVDGTTAFGVDQWERPGGGGGITRILEGQHLEKAAVNFSAVWGETPPGLAENLSEQTFYATGVSVIVHPRNPHAPTVHANLRYFESGRVWFGGGTDLTPCYLYEEDAHHFHRGLAELCRRHPVADYPVWKAACDSYFYLPHRGEARGIGGIFFDRLDQRLDEVWGFCLDLGRGFLDLYLTILDRRLPVPFNDKERSWQELRRGRYVEFNLVWDRGTRFGLDTGGRTESILASLPPRARWSYAAEPAEGTPEAELLALLRGTPRDWA
ncbi:MAG TPA: oxygen-dependent coproporphyrinogen oxidase [Acidimicrobiia bacterium]|nr:oxygen-dependent coproporphyrinogen oxidase [Acidimicrobiia bacterium]